ncbi:MAG: nucleotidyltransferase domain-containing protein [Caldilineaceae bacterium]
MTIDPRLTQVVAEQPYPFVFVTISGAHLYGFPSPDSDYDLRGVHILPLTRVVSFDPEPETIEHSTVRDGLELDVVSHDVKKFFELVLKRNGYVLEQLYSPLVVQTSPEHGELKAIARDCITRHHAHHYLGFAQTQWRLFTHEERPRVKPLLYVYRVLLTGIHLMQSGQVEANLLHLNTYFRLPYLDDLVARKVGSTEQATLTDVDVAFHQQEFERLLGALEQARNDSTLPEAPGGKAALNDLLVRIRLQ